MKDPLPAISQALQVGLALIAFCALVFYGIQTFGKKNRSKTHRRAGIPRMLPSAPEPEEKKIANEFLQMGNFQIAKEFYEIVIEKTPSDIQSWYRIAYCLHSMGRYEEALAFYEAASDSPYYRSYSVYNIACLHALMGNKKKALREFRRSIDEGFESNISPKLDPDFASLVGHPEFEDSINAMETMSRRYSHGGF